MPPTCLHRSNNCVGFFCRPWFAVGVLLLAVGAVYSNSLTGPLISDDLFSIADNPTIRSLWPISNVLNPPGEGKTVQGRPVVNLSLAVNYALGREAVLGYHVFNLAVHILAASVLFGIVRRTLLLPGRPEQLAGQSTGLALAIALLWGVHPLTTNAVTYIIQRAESLMALFYLLTLYCVIRSATADRARLWQAAAVLACLLGMGCKEVMVSAPLIVLLYDRVFLSRSLKECFQQRGLLYAGLAATWVLLAWLVIGAATRGGSAGFGGNVAWWAYGLTQCQAVVTYLKLCFWPSPLVFFYGDDVITDPMQVLPQAFLLAVLLAGTLAALRWQPGIGFVGTCFFAILAPSSSVVPVITETAAERRMYLPLAAVAVLAVFFLHKGWQRIWAGRTQKYRRWRWAPALALVAAVTILGDMTFRRNQDYRSAMAIWTDLINKRPQIACAYNNRGALYHGQGEFHRALEDLTQAVTLKADYYEAYNNRGFTYYNLGQFRQALEDYNRAIALKSDHVSAYVNRGLLYQSLGQLQDSLADFSRAIALKPDCFPAYNNRGITYQRLGQFKQALEDYVQAITLNPKYAEAYLSRGALYHGLGQLEHALADYNQALALDPNYAEVYFNRAVLYEARRQLQQALEDYSRAIALKPRYAEAYNNRGNVYQSLAEFDQAVQDYTRAIQQKPRFSMAYANRARAHYSLKQYDRAWADVARAKELGYTPRPEFLRALSEASGRSQD